MKEQKNAKKVHEYLKKVADENLGKKFLVKIPKDTNIYYREEIGFENYGSATSYVGEITTGPFGFRPEPISASNPTQYFTKAFQTQIRSSLVNGSPPRPFDYLRTRTVDKQFLLGLGNQELPYLNVCLTTVTAHSNVTSTWLKTSGCSTTRLILTAAGLTIRCVKLLYAQKILVP